MTDEPEQKIYTPKPDTRRKMDAFLEAYVSEPSCFGSIANTMKHIGVPRQHFADRWMKNPEFAEQFEDTKELFKGNVRVALHYLAMVKKNPHAIIHLDKKVNREDYQHDKQDSGGLRITINMPGLPAGGGTPALPPVAEPHVLEAQGFVVKPLEYVGERSLGILEEGEEWDVDG